MTGEPEKATMPDPAPSFDGMPDDPDAIERWLFSDRRLDILRGRLALSEIVGRTVSLEQAEHEEMRGACPHPEHDDDQKAFFVSDRQGFFHCFGCGIHGGAIRWLTDYEDIGYAEAVHLLLRQSGLVTPSNDDDVKKDKDGLDEAD
jgi:DNA primase